MRSGFSLVELSIVLVILGLLTGGILAGQSLIRAAELRKIVTQQNNYRTSIRTFQDKYFSLPADFTRGTAVWGAYSAAVWCTNNAGAAVNAARGVCDGNGNGVVDTTVAGASEHRRFWEMISQAGLIEGNYHNDLSWTYTEAQSIGIQFPPSVGGGSGVMFMHVGPGMIYTDFWTKQGHFLRFGTAMNGSSNFPGGIVSPEEAWNIDTKLDDGMPGLGSVLANYAWDGGGSSCAGTSWANKCVGAYPVGNNGVGREYQFTASAGDCSRCSLMFAY